MMLSPNSRSLYTAALTPPPGMVFDEAVGTTFSMDPAVLLSVPVHLALLSGDRGNKLKDGIAVLEAVRRLAERITVFAQRGRLQIPEPPNILYGLLEKMVVEVTAPGGGVFHPKLWVLRFVNPDNEGQVILRLMILSRNLTSDRSWDLALTLEGQPKGRRRADNREFGEFIAALPNLAFGVVDRQRKNQVRRLADEIRRTEWELPWGYNQIRFHVIGLIKRVWTPEPSKRLAIISPFCSNNALAHLASTTEKAEAIISRPETLADLNPKTRNLFSEVKCLDDAAETEDGEDPEEYAARDSFGLHAKAYILERNWYTHIIMGSANATNAALLGSKNIEILAELIGKKRHVGDIDALLGGDGFGEVLMDFPEPEGVDDVDEERAAAEKALEDARLAIAKAKLKLRFEASADVKDTWNLILTGKVKLPDGLMSIKAWPVTVSSDRAMDVLPLFTKSEVRLGSFATASLTGLLAFDLRTDHKKVFGRFVLNLPVTGMPEERDAAILKTVVNNRDGFLRYLLLLLGDLGKGRVPPMAKGGSGNGKWIAGGYDDMPLLEELVRAYSRDPQRLREVERVVQKLTEGNQANQIVPLEFVELWGVFKAALEKQNG